MTESISRRSEQIINFLLRTGTATIDELLAVAGSSTSHFIDDAQRGFVYLKLPCSENVTSGKKPVITSLAGFEPSEPVVTEVAAFAGGFRPQSPGTRNAIPADLK